MVVKSRVGPCMHISMQFLICLQVLKHLKYSHYFAASQKRACTDVVFAVSVSGTGSTHNQNKSWVMKHTFVDSRTSVSDVKFAPKHLGMQLVSNIEYFDLTSIGS